MFPPGCPTVPSKQLIPAQLGWLIPKQQQKITNVGENVEKIELLCPVGGNLKGYSSYGKQRVLKKLKLELLYDLAILLLGTYLTKLKARSQRVICIPM